MSSGRLEKDGSCYVPRGWISCSSRAFKPHRANVARALKRFEDILNGVIKSVVYGVAVTLIALFEGYDAPPTAEGVSYAVTRTVVTSALAVLALDFILTSFMFTGV